MNAIGILQCHMKCILEHFFKQLKKVKSFKYLEHSN
jgi:hypothetical protein